ncbi:Mn transporter [Candidatus Peregrinibacteria bacterium CG_4_9_14_0_2_um_filter_53_11]|nr:MAG: Mn transporter [Candidatus Peregrinibacteria bacterium CG_4_9_14_0_2_um_filter_53_11]
MIAYLKKRSRSLFLLFALIGPGIIAAAVGNDAGGITTYSVAGAHFGYSMLWVMIPITFLLVTIQEMCSRMGVVTKKGLADLIRESYGARVTFYMLISLVIANIATIMSEFAGVASSMEIFGIPRYVSVPVGGVIVWFVITRWNYRSAEKVFLLGALLYLAYIVSGFLARPDWSAVAVSLVNPAIEWTHTYVLTLVGIIGTTITPWMQFYLQASVVEKGLNIEDYKYTKLDVGIGAVVASIVAFFIMVAAAATLFPAGIQIETATDAALALGPLAGNSAEMLFALGLLNASLLGAMIVPLATSYYICEGLGFEAGVDKYFKEAPWFYGIFTILLILGAIPALFPKTPLIDIMIVAQVINGVLLAPVLIFIVLLINKKWLMGEHTNKRGYNIIVWITVILLILLSTFLIATTLVPSLSEKIF